MKLAAAVANAPSAGTQAPGEGAARRDANRPPSDRDAAGAANPRAAQRPAALRAALLLMLGAWRTCRARADRCSQQLNNQVGPPPPPG